ncbi:MAG TPA: HisA/HisF-related TIM barrel protein, partial [Thermoanaerobaculia bacterium]|nr:HisA/HisF-related TIM barrel protein [Thermoanaerobaculia bacterium]
MELFARINILDGRAVRLPHGDVREAIALDADPVARAVGWVEKGADRLLVVDLDAAAYRDYKNRPIIADIKASVDVPVHASGGVRSRPEVTRMLEDVGVDRVGMGTAAIFDQVLLWDLCRDYPNRIFVSLDVLPGEELATRGWTAGSGRYLEEVLIELSSAGVCSFHVMQANRDSLVEPSNLGFLSAALRIVTEPVIASGGARDLQDLAHLHDLEVEGRRLAGVVVGREIT